MNLTAILLGIALLLAGRRLFWLFVAAAGFLYGLSFAPIIFEGGSEFSFLMIALLCGVIGVILGIFVQKLAVGLAGALIGGYFLSDLAYGAGWQHSHPGSIPFLVGAVIGAILVIVLFDWALIIWSSIAGSLLIVESLHSAPLERRLVFLFLAVLGIVLQGSLLRRQRLLANDQANPSL